MHGTLEYPAIGETQDRPRSVLVQKSGHVDDDVQISALGTKEWLRQRSEVDWYRGEECRRSQEK